MLEVIIPSIIAAAIGVGSYYGSINGQFKTIDKRFDQLEGRVEQIRADMSILTAEALQQRRARECGQPHPTPPPQ